MLAEGELERIPFICPVCGNSNRFYIEYNTVLHALWIMCLNGHEFELALDITLPKDFLKYLDLYQVWTEEK